MGWKKLVGIGLGLIILYHVSKILFTAVFLLLAARLMGLGLPTPSLRRPILRGRGKRGLENGFSLVLEEISARFLKTRRGHIGILLGFLKVSVFKIIKLDVNSGDAPPRLLENLVERGLNIVEIRVRGSGERYILISRTRRTLGLGRRVAEELAKEVVRSAEAVSGLLGAKAVEPEVLLRLVGDGGHGA